MCLRGEFCRPVLLTLLRQQLWARSCFESKLQREVPALWVVSLGKYLRLPDVGENEIPWLRLLGSVLLRVLRSALLLHQQGIANCKSACVRMHNQARCRIFTLH